MAVVEAVSEFEDKQTKNDYYSRNDLNFIFSGVMAPVLCILGMIGNILAMLVWNRPALVSSTGRYLSAQAVADFFMLLFYLCNECVQAWDTPIVSGTHYGYYFSYIGYPASFYITILHIWFTVGISVDLCVMVCCVLKAKIFCNVKVANTFIITLTILGMLINIPHFFNYRPVSTTATTITTTTNTTTTTSNATNITPTTDPHAKHHTDSRNEGKTVLSFALTDYGAGDRAMFYEFCIHCLLLTAIPWISICIMNANVIYRLVKTNRSMEDTKSIQSVKHCKRMENHITRLLLGITLTFLVFVGINCIVHCLWILPPPQADRNLTSSFHEFSKTGMILNSVSHFFFYCILSKRFREELCQMLALTSIRKWRTSSMFLTLRSHSNNSSTNCNSPPSR